MSLRVWARRLAAGERVGEREEVLAPRATLGHGGEWGLLLSVWLFPRGDCPEPEGPGQSL